MLAKLLKKQHRLIGDGMKGLSMESTQGKSRDNYHGFWELKCKTLICIKISKIKILNLMNLMKVY